MHYQDRTCLYSRETWLWTQFSLTGGDLDKLLSCLIGCSSEEEMIALYHQEGFCFRAVEQFNSSWFNRKDINRQKSRTQGWYSAAHLCGSGTHSPFLDLPGWAGFSQASQPYGEDPRGTKGKGNFLRQLQGQPPLSSHCPNEKQRACPQASHWEGGVLTLYESGPTPEQRLI